MFYEFIYPRVVQGFLANVTRVFWVMAKVAVELADDLGGAAHFNAAAWATDCMKVMGTHF